MRFTYFKFKNFKGISDQTINLTKSPSKKVFALVGLNESGKTTILEAINYFAYKREDLKSLGIEKYLIQDIHEIIPINLRDNFNGSISIEAGLEFDDADIERVREEFRQNDYILADCGKDIVFTQSYYFKNSVYQKDQDRFTWSYSFVGRKKGGRKNRDLRNEEAGVVNPLIKSLIPNILYFPNFLFEFPEKVYLNPKQNDSKMQTYRKIIQDVLDSLENSLEIEDHLIARINSADTNEKRNLTSLIGKMERKLTNEIFSSWNQIFNKKIDNTEVVLQTGTDANGPFLEFNVKDNIDVYRIVERSLGFRWFFVYILLTRFRSYRESDNSVFFLFDEPASNLHPSAQNELLRSFDKLPYVLYTTHSHYMINPLWLENTYVVKNEAIDYENEEEYNSKNTDIRISRYRDFATKYPDQTSYFQPILEVLDYAPSNLELVPDVIIMEGKNDFYSVSFVASQITDYRNIKIVPGTSASNLMSLISLYLGWGRDFVALLDSDPEGHSQKERYEELFGAIANDKVLTLSDIEPSWSGYELEKLFSSADRLAVIQHYHPGKKQYRKKVFNQCIQEMLVTKSGFSFSKETIKNFEILLTFLINQLGKQ